MAILGDGSNAPQRRPGCQLSLAGWLLVLFLALVGAQWISGSGLWGLRPRASQPRLITARGDLAQDEQATIALFEANQESVVYIATSARMQYPAWTRRDDVDVPRGTGTGFLWDEVGHVVTNFHVINQSDRQFVTLSDGTHYEARYVGGDPANDLAVLKIEAPASKLRAVPVGRSADLRVGQKVFAIGNPFGFDWTLTTGVISGLDRTIESMLGNRIRGVVQTDASINPGNSGGPLLDSAGRLIGVNAAIVSPSGSSAGLGFAIPVDTVNRVVPMLIATGTVERAGLGIEMASDSLARRFGVPGVLVADLVPGGAAERAGLRRPERAAGGWNLDVIVGIDGERVQTREDLVRSLLGRSVGETVRVRFLRQGAEQQVDVVLQEISAN